MYKNNTIKNKCTWRSDLNNKLKCEREARFQIILEIKCENISKSQYIVKGLHICKMHQEKLNKKQILDKINVTSILVRNTDNTDAWIDPYNTSVYINPDPSDPDAPLKKAKITLDVIFAGIYKRG